MIVRQTGQVLLVLNHSSMHSEWKQCSHLAMLLSSSLGWKLSKHMQQVLQSGPEFVMLSLRTTNSVQELNLNSSRPLAVDRGAAAAVAVEDTGSTSAVSDLELISFLPASEHVRRNKQIMNIMHNVTKDAMEKGDLVHELPLDPPAS